MFSSIKKMFIELLTSMVSASNKMRVFKQSEMYDSTYSN